LHTSVSRLEGHIGDGSQDHRTPSQLSSKDDGVNDQKRMIKNRLWLMARPLTKKPIEKESIVTEENSGI